MLELRDICFARDGKQILDNVNLIIDDKKFVVITGPNGGGKSTITKLIMGIFTPTTGKILYNGKDITNLSVDKRANLGINYAFQKPINFKGITVKDLIDIAAGKENTVSQACTYLSKVGLCAKEYIDREVNDSLSGGELKRIEIATVVARGTNLSIFDEPEAGIDLWSFNNLIDLFKKIRKDKNGSTLIISHQEKILGIADKIILMKNGKIVKIGKKSEVMKDLDFDSSCPVIGGYKNE